LLACADAADTDPTDPGRIGDTPLVVTAALLLGTTQMIRLIWGYKVRTLRRCTRSGSTASSRVAYVARHGGSSFDLWRITANAPIGSGRGRRDRRHSKCWAARDNLKEFGSRRADDIHLDEVL
jgi:hypothetical protein